MTGVSDNSGSGNLVGWSTSDELNMGTYTISITAIDATCPYATATGSFTLEVMS